MDFWKGRQIGFMIFDSFKISGTGEALLDFNDLCRVQLKNDNVQGFDTNCDEVFLSMAEVPDEDMLEILYKQQLPYSEELELLIFAGYGAERSTGQLCSIETNGSLLCRAEDKGQEFQCRRKRQVSVWRSSTQKKSQRKIVKAMENDTSKNRKH